MAENEFKPCPFCGNNDTQLFRIVGYGQYQVKCKVCGASSGLCQHWNDAIEAWNRRVGNADRHD